MNPPLALVLSNEILSLAIIQGIIALGMIIKAFVDGFNRIQDRKDRESLAEIHRKEILDVKAKGAEREKRIIDKIDENTEVTKDVKNVLTEAEQIRSMTTLAKKLGSTEPVMYPVKLPGEDYEVFGLSEGSKVYWRNEWTNVGRAARFLVEGPCSMGFHWHKYAEIVSGVRGTLFYEAGEQTVEITPGVTFTTPPDTVHSARFDAPGEVVVHWPDQNEDILEIGIWP